VTREHLRQGQTTRRALLAGAGVAGVTALAACSSGGTSTASGGTPSGSAAAGGSPASGGGTTLGTASDVPVGGGKVFTAEKVVVTQPSAGQYKGFSAICTHQQCTVDQVANGTIDCPCHGSKFSITDGSVVTGPASSPLPTQPITVAGDQITLS
jgi:nitrite reductase/ring-hydroxylating ferredoxin subunit